METIDKRGLIFELNEIFKYKGLIERADRDVIKAIIYDGDELSNSYHQEFMVLVAREVDHELNKEEFYALKNELVAKMKQHLGSKIA